MSDKDYKFGVSKVFFRPGKFSEFDAIMRSDPENLANMISKVKKWLIVSRWKKTQWCALMVIKCESESPYYLYLLPTYAAPRVWCGAMIRGLLLLGLLFLLQQ